MTTIPSGSALIASMESSGLTIEAERGTNLMKLAGESDRSAIRILERPDHGRGETITYYVQAIDDNQDGHGAESQVLGNEQTNEYYKDSLSIDYLGFSTELTNTTMEQQRVTFDLKESKRRDVAGRWSQRWEKSLLAQLTGDTVASAAGGLRGATNEYSGMNAATAQDSGHVIYAGSGNASAADVGADTAALMDLDLIKEARTRASSHAFTGQSFAYAPASTPFGNLYICVMHLAQWQQLLTYGATSELVMLEQAKIEAGFDPSDNTLVSGMGAIWHDTLLLVSDYVQPGITSSAYEGNTRVATFFGAGAAHMGFGEGHDEGNHLGASTETVHRKWSLLADTVWGAKRTIVNSETWACHNIVTYSAV